MNRKDLEHFPLCCRPPCPIHSASFCGMGGSPIKLRTTQFPKTLWRLFHNLVLKGHGFNRAATDQVESRALQAAKKLHAEGDGGFNPRVKPIESTLALATEGRFSGISPESQPFSAASLAPEVRFSGISLQGRPFSAACLAPEGCFSPIPPETPTFSAAAQKPLATSQASVSSSSGFFWASNWAWASFTSTSASTFTGAPTASVCRFVRQ